MNQRHIWVVVALAVAGCTDPELTRESVDKLKAQNAELSKTVAGLEIDISEQDRFLEDYTGRMADILEQISTLEQDELRIQDLSSDLASAPYQERDWASEIGAEIEHIEAALRRNEKQAEDIRNELSSQREHNDELTALLASHQAIIGQQNSKLSQLQQELEQLQDNFLVLQEENARLGIQVRFGESRIASLNQEVSELTEKLTAFVLAGNVQDLRLFRKNDVIKSRMGRLEPHPEGISDGQVKNAFQQVDPKHTTLTVPGNMTKLRLRSIHGKHPDLYTVKAVEAGMELAINDPDAFWGLSRFLILEAR